MIAKKEHDAVTQAYEAARRAILRCGAKGYDLPKMFRVKAVKQLCCETFETQRCCGRFEINLVHKLISKRFQEKFGQWRDIEMTFNPEKMRIK